MNKRNIRVAAWRFAALIGCILAGAIIGEGLRLFGLIGQVLFWLLISFHVISALFLFIIIFSVWKEGKFSSYRGGSLNEYVWLSLLFDSGLVPGLWIQSASSANNGLVIVCAGLVLVLAIFVFMIS